MADPVPTPPAPTPENDNDPWVRRIAAITKLFQILITTCGPYVITMGVSFGWWHTSTNNSNQLQSIHAKIDDNAKELKLMTGVNRNANLKG